MGHRHGCGGGHQLPRRPERRPHPAPRGWRADRRKLHPDRGLDGRRARCLRLRLGLAHLRPMERHRMRRRTGHPAGHGHRLHRRVRPARGSAPWMRSHGHRLDRIRRNELQRHGPLGGVPLRHDDLHGHRHGNRNRHDGQHLRHRHPARSRCLGAGHHAVPRAIPRSRLRRHPGGMVRQRRPRPALDLRRLGKWHRRPHRDLHRLRHRRLRLRGRD